jgi:2-(1,2-epoxy-1,2-dihydrophenyl)acetyl-CoA isomerase
VISSEERGRVSVVYLDRAERRNALVPALLEELVDSLRARGAAGGPLVLTARGSTFCPGADLRWMALSSDPAVAVADLVAVHHRAITTLLDLSVPVIAAINGAVAGGGLGLALACDYRIAARRATFTAAYLRLGLTPDGGSSALMTQMVGAARVMDLMLTNRRLGAEEALGWGLVSEVVEDERLLARAVEFAGSLEPMPGYALRQTRRLLDTVNIRNQLQLESVAIRTAARGAWFRDALKRFLETHPE